MIRIIVILIAHTLACLSNPNSGWQSSYKNPIYTTVSTIIAANVSTICPSISQNKLPFGSLSVLLSPSGCLGYYGPLGPYGPLGFVGPLGTNVWNPEYWKQLTPSWLFGSQIRGALNESGPLGIDGPVSKPQYEGLVDPAMSLFLKSDFDVETRAFGLWSSLGPIGPLGALGPLGPLGPIGNQYQVNENGQYLDNNSQIIQSVTIDYDGVHNRTYPLYKHFTPEYASSNILDTSFFVQNTVQQTYRIGPQPFDQIVTIVVTPLDMLSDLDLVITIPKTGKVIAQSETYAYVETVQMSVPKGLGFDIKVTLPTGYGEYRLFVTGSTQYLNEWNISGDQIKFFYH